MPFLSELLELPWIDDPSRRLGIGVRSAAWSMLLDAALRNPLFGVGWGQTAFAQLQVAPDHPFSGSVFFQAHNLFLDLVLWNGLALGIALSVALVAWFVGVGLRVRQPRDAILFLFLLVLGLHAMLEYPLHYAYFLLPAGIVAGALESSLGFRPVAVTRQASAWTLGLAAAAVLTVTIRDYLNVESSFFALRFEKANIILNEPGTPPDVWALDHLRELIVFGRTEARADMPAREVKWMRDVTMTYPSAFNVQKLAMALAMNGQPAEAQFWLKVACKAFPIELCQGIEANWRIQSLKNPAIAAVAWPRQD